MAGHSGLCRSMFSLGLLLLAAGCTGAPSSTKKSGVDWPRFLGPNSDGVSPETGIRTDWSGGLRILWQIPVGEGYCAPTIANGRLFHFDRRGSKARLTAFDCETHKELWRFEYPTDFADKYGYDGGPRCCPIVDGERVYIFGPEGMLHCVGVADGKLIWKIDTRATYAVVQNFFGVGGSPVVENDLLIVPVGGSPPGPEPDDIRELKGNGSGIVAFDKLTGKERYRTTDELASYSSPVIARIGGRRLGLYWSRANLIGFDPPTGRVAFQFPWRAKPLESVNCANPVIVGDRVLLSECYGVGSVLLKLQPGIPQVVWKDSPDDRHRKLECHWNTPIHVDGFVYGSSGRQSDDAQLRCVDFTTGAIQWEKGELGRSQLVFVDGHFLVFTEFGLLLLVKADPKHFREVARMDLGRGGHQLLRYPCWAGPVLSHGRLYLRGLGKIVCLELIPS